MKVTVHMVDGSFKDLAGKTQKIIVMEEYFEKLTKTSNHYVIVYPGGYVIILKSDIEYITR